MKWVTKERILRILTFVGGAAAAYFGWDADQTKTLMGGIAMIGIAIPWPGDKLRSEELNKLIELVNEKKGELTVEGHKTLARAKRVSVPPIFKNGHK